MTLPDADEARGPDPLTDRLVALAESEGRSDIAEGLRRIARDAALPAPVPGAGLRAEVRALGEWTPEQWDEVRGGDPIARTINAVEDIIDRFIAEGRVREADDGSRLARPSAAPVPVPGEDRT